MNVVTPISYGKSYRSDVVPGAGNATAPADQLAAVCVCVELLDVPGLKKLISDHSSKPLGNGLRVL